MPEKDKISDLNSHSKTTSQSSSSLGAIADVGSELNSFSFDIEVAEDEPSVQPLHITREGETISSPEAPRDRDNPSAQVGGILVRPSEVSAHIKIEGDDDYYQAVNNALRQIEGTRSGQELIAGFKGPGEKGKTVTIVHDSSDDNTRAFLNEAVPEDVDELEENVDSGFERANKRLFGRKGEGAFARVNWNPNLSVILNHEGRPIRADFNKSEEADVALFHELVHARRIVKGTATMETGEKYHSEIRYDASTRAGKEELRVVGIGPGNTGLLVSENAYRQERGLPLRTAYKAIPKAKQQPQQEQGPDIENPWHLSIHSVGTPSRFGTKPPTPENLEAGHAWIALKTPDGRLKTYGAWSCNPSGAVHKDQPKRGVFENAELDRTEKNFAGTLKNGAYREVPLNQQQMDALYKRLRAQMAKREDGWSPLKPSSAVAADLFEAATGHHLNNRNVAGLSSPATLKSSIERANQKDMKPELQHGIGTRTPSRKGLSY